MKYQDLDKSPAYQLWLATNAWQRLIRKALDPLGMTHVQFVLLASIDMLQAEDIKVTQATVSRFAAMDENMTSQVLRSLEERGMLVRKPHPSDARARCVALTEPGKAALEEARAVILPVKASVFDSMGQDAEILAALLSKVAERADNQDATGL